MGIDIDYVRDCYNDKKRINSYLDYFRTGIDFALSYPERKLIQRYLKKEDIILDIGCGVGRVDFALSNLGYKRITGIDISQGMIKEAERVNKQLSDNIVFKVEDVINLSFESNSFDSAIAFHGITPIPEAKNRETALKEVYRILKPGGYIIISTFLREMRIDGFWEDEFSKWENNLQDKRLYDFGDVIFNNDGLEVFIHFPNRSEFLYSIENAGFMLEAEFEWTDLMDIDEDITESQKCKYWVARKD